MQPAGFRKWRRRAAIPVAVLLMACEGATSLPVEPAAPPPPAAPSPVPALLRTTTPTAQIAEPFALVLAPGVLVTDAGGMPVPDFTVRFHFLNGTEGVTVHAVQTNAAGVAAAPGGWLLGPQDGEHIVLVFAAGFAPVAFLASTDSSSAGTAYGLIARRRSGDQDTALAMRRTLLDDGTFRSETLTAIGCTTAGCGGVTFRVRDGSWSRDGSTLDFTYADGSMERGVLGGDSLHIAATSAAVAAQTYVVGPRHSQAIVYDRVSPHTWVAGAHSRYVLVESTQRFALRYDVGGPAPFAYTGRYARTDSIIAFQFDAWNLAGPWLADGIVRGDSLIIRYNAVMQLADFEDGTYVRSWSAR